MSWHYSQEQAEESSEGSYAVTLLSALLRLRSTHGRFFWLVKGMGYSLSFRCGTTFGPLRGTGQGVKSSSITFGASGITSSSREVSPARTSRSRAKVQESMAPEVGCGQKWHGSLARYDHGTSSWRTAQCLLFEDSTECLATLPKWGMTRDGVLSALTMPEHLIGGNVSGLWPTPRAGNPGCDGSKPPMGKDRNHQGLEHRAKHHGGAKTQRTWLTPKTPTGGGQMERNTEGGGLRKLEDQISQEVGRPTGQLNPFWVEWLMGWPIGWTDLKPLEMDRFQKWRDSHGVYLQTSDNRASNNEEET